MELVTSSRKFGVAEVDLSIPIANGDNVYRKESDYFQHDFNPCICGTADRGALRSLTIRLFASIQMLFFCRAGSPIACFLSFMAASQEY